MRLYCLAASHRSPTSDDSPTRTGFVRSTMQTHLILSAIAADGWQGAVLLVRAIHDSGCSVREARIVHFGDHVSVVAGVVGNWNTVAKLEGALTRLDGKHGLQILMSRSGRSASRAETIPYLVEITGADHPGILARMVHFFSDHGISIEDLHATTHRSPYSEMQIASAHFTVGLPASLSLATVRGEFMDLCDELNVDGVLAPIR